MAPCPIPGQDVNHVPGLTHKLRSLFRTQYHSPLEGESQKSSRMAKADAEGGSHKASQRRDLVRRRGNRRRVSVAVGESQKPSRMAKADAVGGRRRRSFGATRAVEAVPSRFVALRVPLIGSYGTPRLPPSGSTAGGAPSRRRVCPPPARRRAEPPRDAAYAPLRIDCGQSPCLSDSPSRGE